MSKQTGGPAFAAGGHPGQQHIQQEGWTLRDYFAAKAMQSLVSLQDGHHPDDGANQAYVWADAMLKVRGGA